MIGMAGGICATSCPVGCVVRKMVDDHLRHHAATIDAGHWQAVYPALDEEQRADAEILRVSLKAAAAGGAASAGASAGELVSLLTEGMASPIGLPAVAVSPLAETAYTAILQIDLACDLASIYGVPFNCDDGADLATLFGLALELPLRPAAETPAAHNRRA